MRLIDLDSEYIQETLYRRGFKTRQDIEEWLNSAPIIDAVPVVRCRECKQGEVMEPKNCTECKKRTTCKSWYGGCGCTEAPMTIFGPRKEKDEKDK